jgi:hypothetical protein
MNKCYFPPGGGTAQVAKTKSWQPSNEQAESDAQLYTQVTDFKFFGRRVAANAAAVAKNFIFDPIGVTPIKDSIQSTVDLNGALFAACMADQTAAAGSPQTNNLSAFTWALTTVNDPTVSLTDLTAAVVAKLNSINMQQTPNVSAPPEHPELLAETFISMRQAGAGTTGNGGTTSGGFDLTDFLRDQLGSLFSSAL